MIDTLVSCYTVSENVKKLFFMNTHYLYPICSYIFGSIPFGLILSNCFGNGLLRETGSKNIGATNVMRTQGKILGLSTFFLDSFKGFFACHFLQTNDVFLNLAIMGAVVIGHMFPLWLKFRGGKGIATYIGLLGALDIYVFATTIIIWIIVFSICRISAVAGLASAVSSCLFIEFVPYTHHRHDTKQLYLLIVLVTLIIAKHRENIRQLMSKRKLPSSRKQ
ncbi:MAG: glycerol-3-phosphate 1-O-acyltransferase PlsY [Holosporaceae bacterium]|nr:glycerol-3-phosphate 1-O-acyltransferase PlsY [Holosporaceae bacterium]